MSRFPTDTALRSRQHSHSIAYYPMAKGVQPMNDDEVERLRRLRAGALRARAVARALGGVTAAPHAVRSQHSAWRIARAITGWLRAHPNEGFQKDAGVGLLLANRIVAAVTALGARNPERSRARLYSVMKRLARELDDARALTRSPELSDSFGRSQVEIRSLLPQLQPPMRETPVPPRAHVGEPLPVAGVESGDWPYLAI